MADLRLMWANTRMVVLVAISAALYAAILVPFKVVPLIPGVTELRPANAIPIVCSLMFGPAAGWGSAIGNMIGDFFGGVGPGDFFGFWANLAYGYIPYKVWRLLAGGRAPGLRSPLAISSYVVACGLASLMCADLIGWGENMLALRPFAVLGNVIFVNDMIAAIAMSPFLLAALYPRVRAGHLLYQDVMPELPVASRPRRLIGMAMLTTGTVVSWVLGNLLSTGYWVPHFLPAALTQTPYDKAIAIIVSPFMIMAVAGLGLL